MGSEIKIILYIIIGIVYLFSRWYRKELKKQNERSMGKRPVSGKTAEDIFRELQKTLNIPGMEERETKPAPVRVKKSVKERKISDKRISEIKPKKLQNKPFVEGGSKLKHYKPIQASKLRKTDNMRVDFVHEAVVASEYGPELDFDARKAVIFSEILKRPQY